MTDQAVVDLVERIALRSAVIGQLKTVAPPQFFFRAAYDLADLFARTRDADEILIIEPVRCPK